MKVQVAKWGNSLAVRLPSRLAAELSLTPGRTVEITRVGGKLELEPQQTPASERRFATLDELVAKAQRLGRDHVPALEDWGDRWPERDIDE